MDYDTQLKLQAYLDGELPEAEAREVANWLARDREAVALHTELRNTRQALVGFEVGAEMPESREFFWSKIEREIQRLEPSRPAPLPVPWLGRLRRLLMPVAGLALLLVAGLLTLNPAGQPGSEMETADSGAFVYHDDAAGATLVWLSYPAESEVANNAELDTID
jgi:anti-sigma factor RsiW